MTGFVNAPINPETVAVSQLTCERVLGIDARRYLDHLRSHPEIPRRRVGRLVVSAVRDWLPDVDHQRDAAPVARSTWSADEAIRKAMGS